MNTVTINNITFNIVSTTTVISSKTTNPNNYYGGLSTDVFTVENSTSIDYFINDGIVLGGGGAGGILSGNGQNGFNGLINSGSITKLINNGAFFGGGGGGGNWSGSGSNGGAGGGGGGGGDGVAGTGGAFGGGGGGANFNGTGGSGGAGVGGGGGGGDGNDGGIGPFGSGGYGAYNGLPGSNVFGGNGGNDFYNVFAGGGGYGNTGSSGVTNFGNGGGGGGGGGGGFAGGTGETNNGGNGGYGIENNGTISTLVNVQGGVGINSTGNIINYGPLFYCGTSLPKYQIIVNSATQYGQLWCTGVNNPTAVSIQEFSIAPGSSLSVGTTYSQVLANVTLGNSTGNYLGYNWELVPNSVDATYYDLEVTSYIPPTPCFKKGTKILTDQGYISIDFLKIGDLIKTSLSGLKPIFLIGKKEIYHPVIKERIKDQLYICQKENYSELTEDLIITGAHCLLVDEFKSEEEREGSIEINGRICVTDRMYRLPACIDKRTSVYEKEGNYEIYHFALENEDYYGNYGVYANGLLVETCSKRYLKELSGMELL